MADLLGERSALHAGTPAPVVSRACAPEGAHRGMVHPIRLQPVRTIRGLSFSGMCRKMKNALGGRVIVARPNPTPLMLSLSAFLFCGSSAPFCLFYEELKELL